MSLILVTELLMHLYLSSDYSDVVHHATDSALGSFSVLIGEALNGGLFSVVFPMAIHLLVLL